MKIPTKLVNPELILSADHRVASSYSDSTGLTSGPGTISLGDITADVTRPVYGDEPKQRDTQSSRRRRFRSTECSGQP
ncbi:MAG: hypothetical protein R3C49_27605 [Planctomycetaceae bacterium]